MHDVQKQTMNKPSFETTTKNELIKNTVLFTCTGKCKGTFKSQETYDKHIAGVKQCNDCKQTFCYPSNLKNHFLRTRCKKNPPIMNKTVARAREYSCVICRRAFTQKSNLTRHLRSKCCQTPPEIIMTKRCKQAITSENSYYCDHCCKSFVEERNLQGHIARIHNKLKPKSCDICTRNFYDNSDLNRHKMTHTGERPFSCDHCDSSFSIKKNMKRHKRRIHNTCEICDKSFKNQDSLKEHMKTNHGSGSLFKCDKCPKLFYDHFNLKKHTFQHNGGKPFTCELCDQLFGSKGSMIRHEIIIHRRYEKSDCSQHELLNTKSAKPLKEPFLQTDQNRNIVENNSNKSDKTVLRNLSEGFCDKENLKNEFMNFVIKEKEIIEDNVTLEHQLRSIHTNDQTNEIFKVKAFIEEANHQGKVNKERDSSRVKQVFIQRPKVKINQYVNEKESNLESIRVVAHKVDISKVTQDLSSKNIKEVISNDNQIVSKVLKDVSPRGVDSKVNQNLAVVDKKDNLKVNKEVKRVDVVTVNISNTDKKQPTRRRCARFQRPKPPKPFPCSLCDLAFNRRLFLTKHMQLVH